MVRVLPVLLFCILLLSACKKEEGPGRATLHAIEALESSGDLYTAVLPNGTMALASDMGDYLYIVKLSAQGSVQWLKKLNLDGYDVKDIEIDGYGEVYICGNEIEYNGKAFMCKVTATGDSAWAQQYGNGFRICNYFVREGDGGLSVAGAFVDPDLSYINGTDFFISRIDGNGTMLAPHIYTEEDYQHILNVGHTPDGGYFFFGKQAGYPNTYMLKTDAAGNKQWSVADTVAGTITKVKALALANGSYVMCGYTGNSAGNKRMILLGISPTGGYLWQKGYGSAMHADICSDMVENADGTITLCGTARTDTTWDAFLFNVSAAGDSLWFRYFASKLPADAQAIHKLDGGDNIVFGDIFHPNTEVFRYYTRTNSQGKPID